MKEIKRKRTKFSRINPLTVYGSANKIYRGGSYRVRDLLPLAVIYFRGHLVRLYYHDAQQSFRIVRVKGLNK